MKPTGADPDEYLAAVTPAVRQRDAHALSRLMTRITGEEPAMWGSIVGFGSYHYRYPTGTEGDAPVASFSPRKTAITLYLPDGVEAHAQELAALGPHTTGAGCLYLKNLDDVDTAVLEEIVRASVRTVTETDFGTPAGDGSGRR